MTLYYEDESAPLKRKPEFPWSPMHKRRRLSILRDYSLVVNRSVTEVSCGLGTYGMGGMGYFGLCLGSGWFVIAMYAAGEKLAYNGQSIQDFFYQESGRGKPLVHQSEDNLSPMLIGKKVSEVFVDKRELSITFDFDTVISLDPSLVNWKDVKDIRKRIYFSPSQYIWT